MSILSEALSHTNIVLVKYDASKERPVVTSDGRQKVSTFTIKLFSELGSKGAEFPKILDSIKSPAIMVELLEEWQEEKNLQEPQAEENKSHAPQNLTLNVDISMPMYSRNKFFCTTKEEFIDVNMHGDTYILLAGMSIPEATAAARQVVKRYMPRASLGVHTIIDSKTLHPTNYFNSYIPSPWQLWRMRNQSEWDALPASPPQDIIEFLKHLIPLKVEREYLYAWLYKSITSRVYVYLVLQGAPGVGKNRLKLLFTALHGKSNTIDGRKETFGANQNRFNGQLFDSTGGWFDELRYDADMEARMKEYQNDSASKEVKGVDATQSSDIHCSMVISNNKERDNYILFNSRKFAPLVLGSKQLNEVMDPARINEFSEKLTEGGSFYDVKYVAQIAKWILKVGPKHVDKFKWMEYQGPKFWELAHSTMSKWQKVAVEAITTQVKGKYFRGWDEDKKAFKWSEVEAALKTQKKLGDRDYRDSTTVRSFFDTYCDTSGVRVFTTETIDGPFQDFWIIPKNGVKDVDQRSEEFREAFPVDNTDYDVTLNLPERPTGMSDYKWARLKSSYMMKKEKEALEKSKGDSYDL